VILNLSGKMSLGALRVTILFQLAVPYARYDSGSVRLYSDSSTVFSSLKKTCHTNLLKNRVR
jgi:hypothetical protein